jgi:hypothetical protein
MQDGISYPPFRMKARAAAAYCDMSERAFLRAVEDGEFPPGQKRAGGTFWLRKDLEDAMLGRPLHKEVFGKRI